MAHIQLVKQTSSGLLLPATPESCDFLHQIKIGEWIHADFKRVRNYAFHKRFFKLLQLGFDYWTPVGGAITPRERKLVSGFVDYLCESVGRELEIERRRMENQKLRKEIETVEDNEHPQPVAININVVDARVRSDEDDLSDA